MRATSTKALLASGAIMAAAVVNAAPAQAEADAEVAAGQVLTFNKGAGPTTGTLVFSGANSKEKWRAGSGNGGNWSNDCASNQGHLPNGTYPTTWHTNYPGSVIHGRAVYLGNKRCSAGTVTRTELFIHSEQTVQNTQGNTEGTRWDGDNDYKSQGCIKMHPNDIAALYKHHAGSPGPTVLNVVS